MMNATRTFKNKHGATIIVERNDHGTFKAGSNETVRYSDSGQAQSWNERLERYVLHMDPKEDLEIIDDDFMGYFRCERQQLSRAVALLSPFANFEDNSDLNDDERSAIKTILSAIEKQFSS